MFMGWRSRRECYTVPITAGRAALTNGARIVSKSAMGINASVLAVSGWIDLSQAQKRATLLAVAAVIAIGSGGAVAGEVNRSKSNVKHNVVPVAGDAKDEAGDATSTVNRSKSNIKNN